MTSETSSAFVREKVMYLVDLLQVSLGKPKNWLSVSFTTSPQTNSAPL
jgi:hypothetical protein